MSVQLKGDSNKILGHMNLITVKKDLGATFANIATELATYGFNALPIIAIMENTNATGAGVRLYVKADNATGWKYVALS